MDKKDNTGTGNGTRHKDRDTTGLLLQTSGKQGNLDLFD